VAEGLSVSQGEHSFVRTFIACLIGSSLSVRVRLCLPACLPVSHRLPFLVSQVRTRICALSLTSCLSEFPPPTFSRKPALSVL